MSVGTHPTRPRRRPSRDGQLDALGPIWAQRSGLSQTMATLAPIGLWSNISNVSGVPPEAGPGGVRPLINYRGDFRS
jgi:hypothetical protein